jgi:uncharacterized membrane protein YgaE (UPF0421/DUF939 family)
MINLPDILTQLVTMVVGGLVTGIVWVVRTILKLQRDLDHAHHKIRGLYERGFSSKDGDRSSSKADE